MSDLSDYARRECISDTLLELERRIQERILAVDESECYDLLLNRPPTLNGESPHEPGNSPPLRYETRADQRLLRVLDSAGENRACLNCDLFGQRHCCGGLLFLYYALRDAGASRPLEWLATEVKPGLHLPDWELMTANSHLIMRKVRDYFEANLSFVRVEVEEER